MGLSLLLLPGHQWGTGVEVEQLRQGQCLDWVLVLQTAALCAMPQCQPHRCKILRKTSHSEVTKVFGEGAAVTTLLLVNSFVKITLCKCLVGMNYGTFYFLVQKELWLTGIIL